MEGGWLVNKVSHKWGHVCVDVGTGMFMVAFFVRAKGQKETRVSSAEGGLNLAPPPLEGGRPLHQYCHMSGQHQVGVLVQACGASCSGRWLES